MQSHTHKHCTPYAVTHLANVEFEVLTTISVSLLPQLLPSLLRAHAMMLNPLQLHAHAQTPCQRGQRRRQRAPPTVWRWLRCAPN
jgi:hypothetical protein